MKLIDDIFAVLGEATAIASETGDPVQTVHSWKSKGKIPRWRRQSVLELARRKGKQLSPEAVIYLSSSDRAAPETQAA